MAENLGNDFATTLNGAIDNVTTSVTVTSGTGAPAANFRVRVDDELMLVTSVGGGTNWTVTRGVESTTAASHSSGATIAHVITKGGLDQYMLERRTLDQITAAAADQTGIANGDNIIRWNWAKTTNNEVAFRFSESAAATNGTSTGGVPNQVLLQLDTLAASTMSPLKVLSRGSHVFSVSPSTAQILAANGSASVPTYSFAEDATTGMYMTSGTLSFASGGVEDARFSGGGNLLFFKIFADSSPYVVTFRKARGSVSTPVAVTSGDDIVKIVGRAYVGSTGSYVEATNITFDTTGTIANNSTGVGGIIRFSARASGGSVAEIVSFMAATTTGGGWQIMDEADANPTTTELDADDSFAMYRKADKFVIAHNVGGTMNYLSIPLDGSTTTWTHSTTAP
ncbi:MAG TPA: hypothetical protein VD931_22775 [Baekduia sp.]|nr:hypothetical protein [Baekduia sp.]